MQITFLREPGVAREGTEEVVMRGGAPLSAHSGRCWIRPEPATSWGRKSPLPRSSRLMPVITTAPSGGAETGTPSGGSARP